MRVRISREYIQILAAFMAKEDIRYYLNGFHVKPHPVNGTVLTATNGHRVVTIHDEDGIADGEYIFPISKGLLAASKKRPPRKSAMPARWVQYIDNRFIVCPEVGEHHEQAGFLVDESVYQVAAYYVEYVKPIDGVYPDVARVFSELKPQATDVCAFNCSYISELKFIAASTRAPIVDIVMCGKDNAMIAIGGLKREMLALVMPARGNFDSVEQFAMPAHAKFAGHQKAETEKAAEATKVEADAE